ncbi:hypothetical protein LTR22_003888 [Elasticomyces elasticus]|nr:hypothetical protein LTR22_003888 [Elasticomyces elasticus]KAK4929661.1 hypothetical protein LTR49_003618 [Elasticomyces elasticus]KAK5761118.1 hypothetical protein LTS12_008796 [Elasticomyces elasticus]
MLYSPVDGTSCLYHFTVALRDGKDGSISVNFPCRQISVSFADAYSLLPLERLTDTALEVGLAYVARSRNDVLVCSTEVTRRHCELAVAHGKDWTGKSWRGVMNMVRQLLAQKDGIRFVALSLKVRNKRFAMVVYDFGQETAYNTGIFDCLSAVGHHSKPGDINDIAPHGQPLFLADTNPKSGPIDLNFSAIYCIRLFDLLISHGIKHVNDMCDGSNEGEQKRFRAIVISDIADDDWLRLTNPIIDTPPHSTETALSTSHKPAPATSHKPAPVIPHKPAPATPHKPTPATPHKPAPATSHKPAPATSHKPAPATSHKPAPKHGLGVQDPDLEIEASLAKRHVSGLGAADSQLQQVQELTSELDELDMSQTAPGEESHLDQCHHGHEHEHGGDEVDRAAEEAQLDAVFRSHMAPVVRIDRADVCVDCSRRHRWDCNGQTPCNHCSRLKHPEICKQRTRAVIKKACRNCVSGCIETGQSRPCMKCRRLNVRCKPKPDGTQASYFIKKWPGLSWPLKATDVAPIFDGSLIHESELPEDVEFATGDGDVQLADDSDQSVPVKAAFNIRRQAFLVHHYSPESLYFFSHDIDPGVAEKRHEYGTSPWFQSARKNMPRPSIFVPVHRQSPINDHARLTFEMHCIKGGQFDAKDMEIVNAICKALRQPRDQAVHALRFDRTSSLCVPFTAAVVDRPATGGLIQPELITMDLEDNLWRRDDTPEGTPYPVADLRTLSSWPRMMSWVATPSQYIAAPRSFVWAMLGCKADVDTDADITIGEVMGIWLVHSTDIVENVTDPRILAIKRAMDVINNGKTNQRGSKYFNRNDPVIK